MEISEAILVFVFTFLCLSLTVLGFYTKSFPICALSGLAWISLFFTNVFGHSAASDYWGFSIVCLGMAFLCFAYMPIINASDRQKAIVRSQKEDDELDETDKYMQELNNYASKIKRPRVIRTKRTKRPNTFA